MMTFIHVGTGLDVVVEPDSTGGFFAFVPALPGCGSQGESLTETLINLDDALVTVLEVIEQDDPDRLVKMCGSMTPMSVIDDRDVTSTAPITRIAAAA